MGSIFDILHYLLSVESYSLFNKLGIELNIEKKESVGYEFIAFKVWKIFINTFRLITFILVFDYLLQTNWFKLKLSESLFEFERLGILGVNKAKIYLNNYKNRFF